ncbi:MAG TPA: nucleotide exchange factor GrpE, partial [Candidatus Coprovivens excrementavium]|nr:nucleotide exchange factor GrpE [Candidatus Coprovivens excrementavium]
MEKEKQVMDEEKEVEVKSNESNNSTIDSPKVDLEKSQDEKVDNKEPEKVEESTKKEDKKSFFKKKEDSEKKKLQDENALLKDKYLRVNAEMQNMRRRMEEEKANLLKYEGEDLIKKLLPVVDNFERAINMDDTNLEDEVSKFLSGFKMIYGNLSDTLKNNEIIAMDVLNKPFDPNTMEAVLTEEVEGVEPNIVIDVLQKGYTYKGKVIRHAMVK